MTHVLTGTLRANVITLDAAEPVLEGQPAHEGRRVRVAFELLDDSGRDDESARLLKAWIEQGPQGPIGEPQGAETPEDADLVLSDEQQLRLLKAWAEHGPQGPIDA